MNQPLFSILIAQYNNGKYFEDCYKSIIAQTYQNWEVIIVDDDSTDDSVAQMKKIIGDDSRFKIEINSENKGCGFTKRKCAELAIGDICAFLDPDDAITAEALLVMVEEHKKHPDASMIYSNLLYCDEYLNVQQENKSRKIENFDPYFFDFEGCTSAFLSYKKKFYDQTQGISSYLLRAVDRDLLLKLYEVGAAVFLDKGLYQYRIHPNGISTNSNQDKAYFWYWVTVIDAAKRRNVNIENLFVDKALLSRREFYLQKEIDSYNKSFIFKALRKLRIFKLM
ncbi:glycosyltransferase [Chryseobacterium sp. MDT2-18]|uniref:glycosyltransferase n=1 Tax=Chryseobacterium sp. MDT2-18 TaxID=1259136 RepID=UPI0027855D61|nr:glycosyltransferase [Chryseobacterium sp. MDT2-18]MDQ0478178.1 glycosyltransferase involved in cell wall biosynthesis [Chryseobacterium sp. MDT2-18]